MSPLADCNGDRREYMLPLSMHRSGLATAEIRKAAPSQEGSRIRKKPLFGQALTDPATIPAKIYRCRNKYMTMVGVMMTRMAMDK